MFNTKNLLIAGAVFAASTGLAFANGGTYVEPHHTGAFYLGAGISGDFGKFDTEGRAHAAAAGSFFNGHEESDIGGAGVGGELFGGYGVTFQNRYYLGLELFGDISSLDARDHRSFENQDGDITRDEGNKIEMNYSWGVAARGGVKLNDNTLAYVRLGYVRTRFKFSGELADEIRVINNEVGTGTLKRSLNGFQAGAGLETAITNNISLGMEYRANIYGNESKTSPITFNGAQIGTAKVTFKPLVQQVFARVTYYFTGFDGFGMHNS